MTRLDGNTNNAAHRALTTDHWPLTTDYNVAPQLRQMRASPSTMRPQ